MEPDAVQKQNEPFESRFILLGALNNAAIAAGIVPRKPLFSCRSLGLFRQSPARSPDAQIRRLRVHSTLRNGRVVRKLDQNFYLSSLFFLQ